MKGWTGAASGRNCRRRSARLRAHWDKVAACIAVRNKASCGMLDAFAQQLPGLLEARTQLAREPNICADLLYTESLTVTQRDRRGRQLTSESHDSAPRTRKSTTCPVECPSTKTATGIDRLSAVIAERDRQISERDRQITERDRRIAERDRQISVSERQIADLTAALSERDLRLANAEAAAARRTRSRVPAASPARATRSRGSAPRCPRRGAAAVPAVDQLEGDGLRSAGPSAWVKAVAPADRSSFELRPPAAEPGALADWAFVTRPFAFRPWNSPCAPGTRWSTCTAPPLCSRRFCHPSGGASRCAIASMSSAKAK